MRQVKKLVVPLGVIISSVVLVLGFILWRLLSPSDLNNIEVQNITVAKGSSVTVIANQLEDARIVKSAFILRLILRSKNSVAPIQAGTFELSPSMNVTQVADALLNGPKDEWITLLEGWRREEMADQLEKDLGLRYFHRDEFLALTRDKEGRLFPDTYLFPKQASASLIVNTLANNFDKKLQKIKDQYGAGPLPPEQNLILASIVVREAKTLADMRGVTGVLLNRLRIGMALQSDVTVQYYRGYDPKTKTWWPEPSAKDKFLDSPYNTYKNKGLPPTPIDNPGLDALTAVYSPTKSDYLYYLADNAGEVHYASTLEEHNANIAKYLK